MTSSGLQEGLTMHEPHKVIDLEGMTDEQAITEIVRLAQASHRSSLSEYSNLATRFVEQCNIGKKKSTLEKLLDEILLIDVNHARISSILRMTASTRNALSNWYTSRDQALVILEREDPERAKRLMIGLLEPDPHTPEEMDGLDAWSSIIKNVHQYS